MRVTALKVGPPHARSSMMAAFASRTKLDAHALYQLDAFTIRRFAGNPAAVMPLDAFPDDDLLQSIAAENNLAETAFLVRDGDDYRLRWFTPSVEVPLCGHATLAAAAVVMERLEVGRTVVVFHTLSGALTVRRTSAAYTMDFPARPGAPIDPPAGLAAALGAAPIEGLDSGTNFVAVFEAADVVRALAPDPAAIARLDRDGVVVTAPGDAPHDFVSRYFAPRLGVPEDPVTGSAHCTLAPYWSARLGKLAVRGHQVSRRGGEVTCRVAGHRVELEGSCVFFLEGQAEI